MIGHVEIAFLGFGLMGGSIARAVRAANWTVDGAAVRLAAWSPSGGGCGAALAEGVIDRVAATVAEATASADLVVIAAPPLASLDLLDLLADRRTIRLGAGTVVTDVASTKALIVGRAAALGLPFVGGHPMAGLETTGYASSRGDLFVDRPWVVVPMAAADERVAIVEDLARRVGARPVRMDASTHDRAVAGISHLPLLLAAALVGAVAGPAPDAEPDDWLAARALAAAGWRDMTRLARGDATMAAGIAVTNAAALAGQVRAVQAELDAWLAELEAGDGPDADRIRERFAAIRRRLDDPAR